MISKCKRILFLITTGLFCLHYAYGQTQTTRKTPKNSIVYVGESDPGSDITNINKDNAIKTRYGDTITVIPSYRSGRNIISSSESFNCHGYAWHMALFNNNDVNQSIGDLSFPDPDEQVWIDDYLPYINDSSYIKVDTYIHPAIVKVGEGHSAITTSDPNIVISKWENDVLAIHPINVGPYAFESSQIGTYVHYYIIHDYCDRYYKEFIYTLSGSPQEFTSKPAFTVNNLQDYDEVIWEYSSNLIKDEGSSGHNTITFDIDCNSSAIIGWVRATVNHAPGNSECEKNGIDAGTRYVYTKPEISVEDITFSNYAESPTYTLCNSHYNNYYHIDNKNNFGLFQVQICHMNGQVIYQFSTSSTTKSINYPNLNGMYLFRVKGRYYCEYNNAYFYSDWCEYIPIEYTDCSEGGPGGEGGIGDEGPGGLTIGPNPAKNEITVKISGKLNLNDELIYHENWNVEIYNLLGVKVVQKNNLEGNEHSISTAGLKNGTYIVIAKSCNNILRGKVRIEN